ncbi:MAG: response regulator transcription factor [Bacteroidota bacterium]
MQTIGNTIKIAYADDHKVMRKGIVSLIEADNRMSVIIEGDNGEELLNKLIFAKEFPDVCLIDINMPVMDGYTLLREIRKRWPELPCIILTGLFDEYYVIEMIKIGANGYLLKSCSFKEIIDAIYSVCQKGYYYNDLLSENIIQNVLSVKQKLPILNDREIEFLRLLCSELSYIDIAQKMNTTFKTVDGIRERLGLKLRINSKVGLVIAAIRLGFYVVETESLINRENTKKSN